MNQKQFITNLLQENKDTTFICSLGTITYDVDKFIEDNKIDSIEASKFIRIRGNMGGAMGVALGYALALPERKVICLIGDGAFLMQRGTEATILKYAPKNLRVIIINNGQHKSTGGQKTNFDCIGEFTSFEIVNTDEIYINKTASTPQSDIATSRDSSWGGTNVT